MKSATRTLFIGLLASFSALAAPGGNEPLSAAELTAYLAALAEVGQGREIPCRPLRPTTRSVVIAFEGAMGHCSYRAVNELDGHDYRSSFEARLRATPDDGSALRRKVDAVRKLHFSVGNCMLARTLIAYQPRPADTEILYYTQTGRRDARACLKEHLQTRPDLEVNVLGYSMGGGATVRFLDDIRADGITVERVLTVDPVGKGMRWVNGVLWTKPTRTFWKPMHVRHWENIYQTEDRASLTTKFPVVRIGARGSPVRGADSNLELELDDFADAAGRRYPHTGILRTRAMKDSLTWLFGSTSSP